jgi:hypothetical protein
MDKFIEESVLLICNVECFISLEFFLLILGQEKAMTRERKEHLTNHIAPY